MNSWPETRLSLLGRLAEPDDMAAWEYFQSSYQQAIYRYARSRNLQPSDGMDVVQRVMVAVYRQASTWRTSCRVGSFRAWLAETMRRITLDTIRSNAITHARFPLDPFTDLTDARQTAGAPVNDIDEQRWHFYTLVAEVEKQTNPQQWQAFWLTALNGLSPTDAAQRLGMEVGAVYTAKCRIIAKMRAAATLRQFRQERGTTPS